MAFAPGKLILLGEHAVVYGVAALAGALDKGVEVTAAPGDGVLRVPAWGVAVRPGDDGSLGAAYTALRAVLDRVPGFVAPPVDLTARFDLPTGAGLGSSAALAVAVARALAAAAGIALDHAALCDAAMASETVFHGRPSGIDHAVSAAGGFGLFTRAEGLRPLHAARPVGLIRLLVGHTGRARDTRGRVARVAELLAADEAGTRARFDSIAALVRRAASAILDGDLPTLGAAMDENQVHLAALEVSSPEIDRMCALAREAGALGAKLTGGGGGGCVIALAPGREEAVAAAWAEAGFGSFETRVGGPSSAIGDPRA